VAGNALTINDYVDFVADQGELAAEGVVKFMEGDTEGIPSEDWIELKKGRNIRLVAPHYISGNKDVTLYARVKRPEPQVKIGFEEIDYEIEGESVNPGEMINIELEEEDLQNCENELTLKVYR